MQRTFKDISTIFNAFWIFEIVNMPCTRRSLSAFYRFHRAYWMHDDFDYTKWANNNILHIVRLLLRCYFPILRNWKWKLDVKFEITFFTLLKIWNATSCCVNIGLFTIWNQLNSKHFIELEFNNHRLNQWLSFKCIIFA